MPISTEDDGFTVAPVNPYLWLCKSCGNVVGDKPLHRSRCTSLLPEFAGAPIYQRPELLNKDLSQLLHIAQENHSLDVGPNVGKTKLVELILEAQGK